MSVPIELDIEQAELIYVWIEKYKNIEKFFDTIHVEQLEVREHRYVASIVLEQ